VCAELAPVQVLRALPVGMSPYAYLRLPFAAQISVRRYVLFRGAKVQPVELSADSLAGNAYQRRTLNMIFCLYLAKASGPNLFPG
jgi:hypothetical protein